MTDDCDDAWEARNARIRKDLLTAHDPETFEDFNKYADQVDDMRRELSHHRRRHDAIVAGISVFKEFWKKA